MLYALGVLIFAIGLLASIALHEVGHMVPAKRFGVKVTQYMVGFGPTVFSRKKGDTEYGLKAIPLGGYIRMIGMVPPRKDGKVSRWPSRMASAVEEFRAVSRNEVGPGDEDRQFYRLTPGKKMIVMTGGPAMNFLIYLILTVILALTLGTRHDDPTTTIAAVSQCVVKATDPAANSTTCPAGAKRAPANGVLQSGDVLLDVNGQRITQWSQVVSVIEDSAATPVSLTIRRNGVVQTVSVTPVENVKYANDSGTQTKTAGFIGVEVADHVYYSATPVGAVPRKIADQIGQSLSVLGHYPSRIQSVWDTVFEGKPRNPNGAIGVVGIGRIGGEIASSHALVWQDKVATLIGLLASVNLLLFFFNLLPLLPLDGGHVAGALLESVKRGKARLRHRRAVASARAAAIAGAHESLGPQGEEPGVADSDLGVQAPEPIYVDTAAMLPVVYAVASLLILVTLLIGYADIVKPVTLG